MRKDEIKLTHIYYLVLVSAIAGGDYEAEPRFTASFVDGTEDIELDVSDAVERWIAGTRTNYGFGVRMENETAFSSSYTKKFFARGSEFFFSRPVIEARWDSAIKDDRGNFYLSR